uniref:Uncharacterized protein n=1 Tax=Rhizophora mucronata TaxID=61149 RepID=A0A2P2QVW2_RHIMU
MVSSSVLKILYTVLEMEINVNLIAALRKRVTITQSY